MSQIKEAKVIEILKQCYDPELPVDLWNLGLIYNIQIQEAYDETKSDINIVMSLTTPGCTMGDQIAQDIRNKLEALTEVNQAFVEVTFDPPWNPEMITEEAKKKLAKLSGKKHHIYSSAAAYYKNKLVWKTTQKTTIKVRRLKRKVINEYLQKTDKIILLSVVCFQIEKEGPNIIENIKGDFFNVMGFPLFPFLLFLIRFNVEK